MNLAFQILVYRLNLLLLVRVLPDQFLNIRVVHSRRPLARHYSLPQQLNLRQLLPWLRLILHTGVTVACPPESRVGSSNSLLLEHNTWLETNVTVITRR